MISLGLGLSPALRSVSLVDNYIGDDGAEHLAEPFFLPTNNLEHLNLANNGITDKGGMRLTTGLL